MEQQIQYEYPELMVDFEEGDVVRRNFIGYEDDSNDELEPQDAPTEHPVMSDDCGPHEDTEDEAQFSDIEESAEAAPEAPQAEPAVIVENQGPNALHAFLVSLSQEFDQR